MHIGMKGSVFRHSAAMKESDLPRAATLGDKAPSDSTTIFVGNLAMRSARSQLDMEHNVRQYFARCGMILAVRLAEEGRGFCHAQPSAFVVVVAPL